MKQNHWLKLIVALILSAVLMLCAVSCGDDNQDPDASTQESAQQSEELTTAPDPDESLGGFSKNY